jgi:hypothetical protein
MATHSRSFRALSLSLLGAALSLPGIVNCSSTPETEAAGGPSGGASGSSGAATGGTGAGAGGSTTGGTAGSGAQAGMSGTSGSTSGGTGGSFVAGGMGGGPAIPPLECGGKGAVIENHGPTTNRVNYVIIGDGYSEAELETTYLEHIQTYMTKRFSDPVGQVYLRYRNFVNVCAIKIPSTPICGSSTFGCCGDDQSRLARCNNMAINQAIDQNLPATFEVDWNAAVLNGNSWWNTGAQLMLWSGGNRDAAGGALHEGGHGFHQLADEYGDCGGNQVNNTDDNVMAEGKWDLWLGYDQQPGTGEQGFYECMGSGNYRPAVNSMMDSLFGNDPDTSFNAPSREKMIMDIWRIIEAPWDSLDPPEGAVTSPAALTLNLIDPMVISVDWTVDGQPVMETHGPSLSTSGFAPGTHTVTAKAYDNAGMDLVRYRTGGNSFNRQYWGPPTMANGMRGSEKTATWTVTIP